jgi:hypothetical protein
MSDEAERLKDALQNVERRVASVLHDLRRAPAEAERLWLSRLLGQVANEMFNGHAPVYPSNLLDVISAWLAGWEFGDGSGHREIEKSFRDALTRAEAKLAERAPK